MRFLMAIILFLGVAPAAMAGDMGIQFAKMPVGTKIHYKDYEGDQWVDEFAGLSGRTYIMRRKYVGDNFYTKHYYNLQGHLVKRRMPSGFSIKYTPQACRQVLGNCTERYRGNPKYDGKYVTTQKHLGGNKYAYSFTSVQDEETFDYTHVYGRYNILMERSWQSSNGKRRFVRVTKIE